MIGCRPSCLGEMRRDDQDKVQFEISTSDRKLRGRENERARVVAASARCMTCRRKLSKRMKVQGGMMIDIGRDARRNKGK